MIDIVLMIVTVSIFEPTRGNEHIFLSMEHPVERVEFTSSQHATRTFGGRVDFAMLQVSEEYKGQTVMFTTTRM